MSEREAYFWLLGGFAGLGVLVFCLLLRFAAPYGRHARPGWGPVLPPRWAWAAMEWPAPVGMAAWFALGGRLDAVSVAFLVLWETHYVHRAFVYPFLIRPGSHGVPLAVVLAGLAFNAVNSYLNGCWLFTLSDPCPASWLGDPRFVAGTVVFVTGLAVNWHADHRLRSLRGPGRTDYRVPRGGLFELVVAPNYLGEWVEWVGWAVLTWSWPGAVFALWTFANLAPRAVAHRRWLRERFPEESGNRKALIPFLL